MEKNKKIYSIGIDVSKSTLDVCILKEDMETIQEFKILNNKEGIGDLLSRIKKIKDINLADTKSFSFILESTGSYHLYSSLALLERGYSVKVFNPILSSKYSKTSIRKIKTDKIDARRIAEIGFKEDVFDFVETKEGFELKKRINLITKLQKEKQTLNQSINQAKEDFKKLGIKSGDIFKELDKIIYQLDKAIKKIKGEIIELGKNVDCFKEISEIKGLGDLGISILLAILKSKTFSSKQSLNAFVGFDIGIRQSGTSINYKGRITKRGNAILRKVLTQMAWGLMIHNEYFKPMIDYYRNKGRHYFEILVILARKILYIIYGMLKNNSRFDPTKIGRFC